MRQGLSSGDECIVEGVVHEIVKGGGVQVGKGGQSTAEVGGALLCTKYTTESKIMCFLEVFSTQKTSTIIIMKDSSLCNFPMA